MKIHLLLLVLFAFATARPADGAKVAFAPADLAKNLDAKPAPPPAKQGRKVPAAWKLSLAALSSPHSLPPCAPSLHCYSPCL